MNITSDENLAVKRHARSVFTDLRVRSLADYEPHRRDWSNLCKDENAVATRAREMLDRITDATSVEEARAIESASDVLIDVIDAIKREKDIRSELGHREARTTSHHPRTPMMDGTAPGLDSRGNGDSRTEITTLRGLVNGAEARAMSVGSQPDGGFTVPKQIDQTILDQLVDVSPIRRVAEVVTTESSDFTKLVNRRGATSNWGNEQSTRTETETPLIASIKPPMGELWAYPTVSTWLMDDSSFNLQDWLGENVATEFGYQEGAAFINGSGVDRPKGFLQYDRAATADASRDFGTIEKLVAASATALDEDELVQLVYKLRPGYRQGGSAAWMMNSTTAGAVRQLKDSNGRFLWAEGLAPGQPPMLLGYPVIEAEDMPDIATGQVPIAFGNWRRGYLIADRIGTRLIVDNVTTPGFIKLYFAKRTGGAVTDSNAIKLLEMA